MEIRTLRKALLVSHTNGFLLSAQQQNAVAMKIVTVFNLCVVFCPNLLDVEPQTQT